MLLAWPGVNSVESGESELYEYGFINIPRKMTP